MSILSPLTGTLTALGTAGARAIAYLLRDEFTTNQAAPLTSPRTCEPGPGTLTMVDTNNAISISGASLAINGTLAAQNGVVSSTFGRQAGRAFSWSVPARTTIVSNVPRFGWSSVGVTSSTMEMGFDYASTTSIRILAGGSAIDTLALGSGQHDCVAVMRGTGAFLLVRNGGSGVHTLAWVLAAGTANLLAKFMGAAGSVATLNLTSDDWRVTDLPAPWDSDYGIATDRIATTVNGSTITMTADAIVEHTFTAQTGTNKSITVRRTDIANRWIVECIQGSSTIELRERVAGVNTIRATAAQTWTNGTSYRVVTICEGATIRVYVNNTLRLTYSSATFNQTATIAAVDHAGTDLVAWPRTVTLPSGV